MSGPRKDLLVLVADQDQRAALRSLLEGRRAELRIGELSFDLLTHDARDPGCANAAHDLLRPYCAQYRYALVLFDREGSGWSRSKRKILEMRIEQNLARNGWSDRCVAIAIEPELEAWVWVASPRLEDLIGWDRALQGCTLQDWLASRPKDPELASKPADPKATLEAACRRTRQRRSAALFARLGQTLPLDPCQDPAFTKLRETLRRWFPA